MKREAEDAEQWLGVQDEAKDNLKKSRRFIDKLSSLTSLCVKSDNRVIDFGKDQDKEEPNDNDFEFLNISELEDMWDNDDKKVIDEDEIPDDQNQQLLCNLNAQQIPLELIKQKRLEVATNKNAYLKVIEKAYIFLLKFVRKNKAN